MSDKRDFLFEIGTEELPPKALSTLSEALCTSVQKGLDKAGLEYIDIKSYASPRRLAVLIYGLVSRQEDTVNERRGPAITAAFDDQGNPTPAAQGFARSCGVEVEQLETLKNDKSAWLVYHSQQKGQPVNELLPSTIEAALAALPIPKRMHWGRLKSEFVRPVHWLVMLFGNEVINAEMFGVSTGRETFGHRFHHPGSLYLAEPEAYVPLLETEGHVIADFAARREAVRAQVLEVAIKVGGQAVIDDALLDEVTGMVEWPVALAGDFDQRFLEVPAEALISAMKGHQKYFHVVDYNGKLMPHFITISNIDSRDMSVVRAGNERVIRPRLADAAFFWEQDRKQSLFDLSGRLKTVVFQEKLGTLYQKTERIVSIASRIAEQLGGNKSWAERAGYLCKSDLMTDMVGEFPELQGIMGHYYAAHDGEPDEVALALDEQYLPRFAGDKLPATITGQAIAIADKLDSVVGIFAIGQVPSGDKDPFALRRAALGVLRILIESKLELDLVELLDTAVESYRAQANVDPAKEVVSQVYDFMMERLRAYYLDADIAYDVFDAVLSRRPTRPYDFDRRIHAVAVFRDLPEAESLSAANKRIKNILRKAEDSIPEVLNDKLIQEDAERALAKQMGSLSSDVNPLLDQGEYTEALTRLAALRIPVDIFFDEVMVMAEDKDIRTNRLALLGSMHDLFMRVADLSCLQAQNSSQ